MADERTGLAAGLAVGLASAAVLGVGVIFLYLLLRREQGQLSAPPISLNLSGLGYPQVPQPWAVPSDVALPVTQVSPKLLGSGPTMTSTTVPKTRPTFLAAASSAPVRVTVRPVAPVAGFVVLAYNAAALEGSEINQSNGFIVPVGQEQVVRLMPKQQLYARALVPADESVALVSVIKADAPADV